MDEKDWEDLGDDEEFIITINDWDRWAPLGKALKDSRITESPVWDDPEELKMWLFLIMEAKQ